MLLEAADSLKIKSKCWRVLEQRSEIYWAIKKREMKFNGSKREREREGFNVEPAQDSDKHGEM